MILHEATHGLVLIRKHYKLLSNPTYQLEQKFHPNNLDHSCSTPMLPHQLLSPLIVFKYWLDNSSTNGFLRFGQLYYKNSTILTLVQCVNHKRYRIDFGAYTEFRPVNGYRAEIKNLHCFVDFWEIEGIWTRIKIEEAVEAFVNLWKFSLPADSASFSVLWCGLLLLLFLLLSSLCFSTTLHPLFLVFTACESQCKILNLVVSDGKWKRQGILCSLFTHSNGHVSLTWPVVYLFLLTR